MLKAKVSFSNLALWRSSAYWISEIIGACPGRDLKEMGLLLFLPLIVTFFLLYVCYFLKYLLQSQLAGHELHLCLS